MIIVIGVSHRRGIFAGLDALGAWAQKVSGLPPL